MNPTPKFKPGDKVRAKKPKDVDEFPSWTEQMDYIGDKILTIDRAQDLDDYINYYYVRELNFTFNEKWLESLSTTPIIEECSGYCSACGGYGKHRLQCPTNR